LPETQSQRQPGSSSEIWARLADLLAGDLDFQGAETGYASHQFHSFAAKFPPQLPRLFIRNLSKVGQIVLDPMAGSGTTVVEAALLGRLGIGVDLDPLAVQIGRAKTTEVPGADLARAA
ncbi:MAG: site-specific DNA-methyltransferase, partial [Thermoflexia bacterium]